MHNPDPLTAGELQRLHAWERMMQRFYVIAIPGLLASAAVVVLWSDAVWLRRLLLVAAIALVVVATVLQLRQKCPRCEARLRTTMLLRLAQRCHYCGVPFRDTEAG